MFHKMAHILSLFDILFRFAHFASLSRWFCFFTFFLSLFLSAGLASESPAADRALASTLSGEEAEASAERRALVLDGRQVLVRAVVLCRAIGIGDALRAKSTAAVVEAFSIRETEAANGQFGSALTQERSAVFVQATVVVGGASHPVIVVRVALVHLADFDFINGTQLRLEAQIVRIDVALTRNDTSHFLVSVILDKGSGAVVHDGVIVVRLSVPGRPAVC